MEIKIAMDLTGRDFLTLKDYTPDEIEFLINLAGELKEKKKKGVVEQLLACVIDWESGWEPYEGKLAVANVVLNRVRNSRYDNTITGVIYARSQFSGVSDGYGNASSTFQARLDAGPRTQECLEAAMEALSGVNNIGSYTSFRSVSIANYDAYSSFTIIGGHVFY